MGTTMKTPELLDTLAASIDALPSQGEVIEFLSQFMPLGIRIRSRGNDLVICHVEMLENCNWARLGRGVAPNSIGMCKILGWLRLVAGRSHLCLGCVVSSKPRRE